MCIGYRTVRYACECEYDCYTKQCLTAGHDHSSETLPEVASRQCQAAIEGWTGDAACQGLDPEQMVGRLVLNLLCDDETCLENFHAELQEEFCNTNADLINKMGPGAKEEFEFAYYELTHDRYEGGVLGRDVALMQAKLHTLRKKIKS